MQKEFPVAKFIIGGIAALIALIIISAVFPVVVIPAGYRGVVFNNVSGIENRILGEGTHFRTPFVESVVKLPIQTQATSFDENAGSSDSQTIDVKVTVNWHLDPSEVNHIYQQIGDTDAVVAKVLTNNTQDAVKASVSRYQALDFQRNRENVRAKALELLQQKVSRYHVFVDNLSFTDIQFSQQFNAAVEQAQVAQQQAKQAEYQVQTAKAQADSAIAKAEGEAKAQAEVQQSLTPELLEKLWIEKWNGQLPTTNLGSGSDLPIPVFNVGK